MALDPEVLLNYPIPEVRQRYSRRDSAFYALTLGLGGDPLDERQLVYVDPCRDLQALPCMALVLGHPGFWLGNPATGVDALRLVHGEQRLEWRRPLPAEGEVIGRTRVTGLVQTRAPTRARCSTARCSATRSVARCWLSPAAPPSFAATAASVVPAGAGNAASLA